MKTANELPQFTAEKFMGKTHAVLEAQVMYAGIELDLFRKMESPVSLKELVEETGCDFKNLELLLNALTSINLLKKENNLFCNLPDTNYYLNPESEMYLGEHILYWRDMTNLDNIVELVKHGPQNIKHKDKNGSDFFDFRAMGNGARNTMYLGRVQKFIKLVRKYFQPDQEFKVFDMGGGSGIFSIEIAKNFPKATCTIFDQQVVIELTEQIIKEYKAEKQVKTLVGNFINDNFQEKYDFIIASGVFDFVGNLDDMSKKIYDSLNDGGYLYVNTHGINEEFTAPKSFILGWLSSHLNGLDILKSHLSIKTAIKNAGFEFVYEDADGLSCIARKIGYEG